MTESTKYYFLELIRAGLWETRCRISAKEKVDWDEIYRLTQEQSVLGLVLAGLDHSDLRPPQDLLLQWIGEIQMIEQQNIAMNTFIESLTCKMNDANIFSLLVKGQGVAQCYERPFWRAPGDIDLLLDDDNYVKAKSYFPAFSSSVKQENPYTKHLGMDIDGWIVELHGNMRSNILERIDCMIDSVQKETFGKKKIRLWHNGETEVFLPSPDNDVIFVFTHILHHFYRSGIGLRQICDWCRLLYKYQKDINMDTLRERIVTAAIMPEWIGFGHFAVEFLGMPQEHMPFYSKPSTLDKKKEQWILSYVLKTGNFGQNRDRSFYTNKSYFVRKLISFRRNGGDILHHFFLFPGTSSIYFIRFLTKGCKAVLEGE